MNDDLVMTIATLERLYGNSNGELERSALRALIDLRGDLITELKESNERDREKLAALENS